MWPCLVNNPEKHLFKEYNQHNKDNVSINFHCFFIFIIFFIYPFFFCRNRYAKKNLKIICYSLLHLIWISIDDVVVFELLQNMHGNEKLPPTIFLSMKEILYVISSFYVHQIRALMFYIISDL